MIIRIALLDYKVSVGLLCKDTEFRRLLVAVRTADGSVLHSDLRSIRLRNYF